MPSWLKALRFLPFLLLAGLLGTGCSGLTTMPEDLEDGDQSDELRERMIQQWNDSLPDIMYRPVDTNLMIDEPDDIPEHITEQTLTTRLNSDIKLRDLSAILEPFGIHLMIPDTELRDQPISIFSFSGKLGDFLNALSVSYGISFGWEAGNILVVQPSGDYMVRVPQDEDLIGLISTSLQSFGAEDVNTSLVGGVISYSATNVQHRRIRNFLEIINTNSAVISLQIAAISVAMDRDRDFGIDYGALQMAINREIPGSGNQTTDATESAVEDISGLIRGSGVSVNATSSDFSLGAVMNYLSTFGNTEARQSVVLKTLSGHDVSLQSGQELPYIESVGVTTNEGSVADNSLGSADVSTLETGLSITVSPIYQHADQTVTMDVDLDLTTLLQFVELSAGNQIGSISRPSTQKQAFNDYIRMRVGETAIIGGINFDSISDNRSLPAFLDRFNIATSSVQMSRNSLIIMIRPTVTIFGTPDSKYDPDEVDDIVVDEAEKALSEMPSPLGGDGSNPAQDE